MTVRVIQIDSDTRRVFVSFEKWDIDRWEQIRILKALYFTELDALTYYTDLDIEDDPQEFLEEIKREIDALNPEPEPWDYGISDHDFIDFRNA